MLTALPALMTVTDRKTPEARSRTTRVLDAPTPRSVTLVGSGAERTVDLDREHEYSVGREPGAADFVIDNGDVSRLHGRLYFDKGPGLWVYRDLNSTNGTFVGENRERVSELPLEAGDVLYLGGSVAQLRFSPNNVQRAPIKARRFTSAAWARLEDELELIAHSPERVMIYGPRGSGKTTLAHEIHERSLKNSLETGVKREIISLNCGALPADENFLASEFFGHVRGAFTDAKESRTGKLEAARDGTLFLDEVESLNPRAAAFLLSILDGRANAAPVGSNKVEKLPRFRIIGTTKRPLSEIDVRNDLFDRFLMGHIVTMPSLAEREEDLPALVRELLEKDAAARLVPATVSDEALEVFASYDWPGETRELETVVRMAFQRCRMKAKGAVVLTGDAVRLELDKRQLLLGRTSEPAAGKVKAVDLKKEHVEAALEKTEGKILPAAKLLGISRTTLKEKMKDFGIARPSAKDQD